MTEAAKMKWLVLIYGRYGVQGYGALGVVAKVLEIDAATPDELWDKLRSGALTGGDNLDDIRLDCIQPSTERRPESAPVEDDTTIRVFRADEIPFTFLSDYLNERAAREAAQRSVADEAAQIAVMRAIAERLGYRCEKQ